MTGIVSNNNNSRTSGIIKALDADTGPIVQVKHQAPGSGTINSTSTSFEATSYTASITVTAGNYVLVDGIIYISSSGGGADTGAEVQWEDDQSTLRGVGGNLYINSGTDSSLEVQGVSCVAYWAPATGNEAVTVTLQIKAPWGGTAHNNYAKNQVILYEIEG